MKKMKNFVLSIPFFIYLLFPLLIQTCTSGSWRSLGGCSLFFSTYYQHIFNIFSTYFLLFLYFLSFFEIYLFFLSYFHCKFSHMCRFLKFFPFIFSHSYKCCIFSLDKQFSWHGSSWYVIINMPAKFQYSAMKKSISILKLLQNQIYLRDRISDCLKHIRLIIRIHPNFDWKAWIAEKRG